MKCLIVEDDLISSRILEGLISRYATCNDAINSQEAMAQFLKAHESGTPYDLILMDIMMPETNGLQTVRLIREKEELMNIPLMHRVKVIMTTALDDPRTVIKALFESDANSYITKPVTARKLADELRNIKLIL